MKTGTYLHFNGNCKEAMTFYADVLGGDITMLMQFKEAPEEMCKSFPKEILDLTMHCTLEVGELAINASDFFNDKEKFNSGNNFAVTLNSEDEDEAITVFNGLAEGGFVMMPLEDAFWGGKFGMLQDKFGIRWMMSLESSNV
ncbi:VOC family protein [Tenacibaculum ovolyticum]|uniref:VOC family protein n=1 Tax=Tenacibaculum ovolyticum TaxID=104270 RepID=UPI0022F38D65|nr:VOC family protein [Tenacibaculum ovolyticum]WBX74960.1 VOC family protein [Tenacibaculum ovolyticum]